MKSQGAEVIYVDLWSDRSRDHGDLISEAVGEVKPTLYVLHVAFVAAGHKPESLRKALDDLAFCFDVTAENVDTVFQEVLNTIMADAKQGFMRAVNGLSPLQAAVLTVMAITGHDFAPFRTNTYEM